MNYLSTFIPEIKAKTLPNKVNQILSPMGSGKTTAIVELIKSFDDTKTFYVSSPFRSGRLDFEQKVGALYSQTVFGKKNSFLYYSTLCKEFLNFVKKKEYPFTTDREAIVTYFDEAAAIFSKELEAEFGKCIFFLDEFDFVKTQLDMTKIWAEQVFDQSYFPFEYKEMMASEKLFLGLLWTVPLLKLLKALSADHTIYTFSANGFDESNFLYEYDEFFNTIEIEADTGVRFRSFDIVFMNITHGGFSWNMKKLLDDEKVNKRRPTLFSCLKVTDSMAKLFYDYAKENFLRVCFIGRRENTPTNVQPDKKSENLWREGVYEYEYVTMDGLLDVKRGHCYKAFLDDKDSNITSVEKCVVAYEMLDKNRGLFEHFDIVIINTSSTRQASIFLGDDENALVINYVTNQNLRWLTNHTQSPGRFRYGSPSVINVFGVKVKVNDSMVRNSLKTLERYKRRQERFFHVYFKGEVKVDHERYAGLVGKAVGLAVGKAKGKAVSDASVIDREQKALVFDIVYKAVGKLTLKQAEALAEDIAQPKQLKRAMLKEAIKGLYPTWYREFKASGFEFYADFVEWLKQERQDL